MASTESKKRALSAIVEQEARGYLMDLNRIVASLTDRIVDSCQINRGDAINLATSRLMQELNSFNMNQHLLTVALYSKSNVLKADAQELESEAERRRATSRDLCGND